jgi:nitrite reductase/ring-hydroxylating ferredoxin subunit
MAEYTSVAKTSEVSPGQVKQIELDDGTQICLANVDGAVHAIGGECTHQGGPLGEGELDGHEVICPWHGGMFDVTTGEATGDPASEAEPKYDVLIEGDEIKVAIE